MLVTYFEIYSCILLEKTQDRIAGAWADIWNRCFRYTKQFYLRHYNVQRTKCSKPLLPTTKSRIYLCSVSSRQVNWIFLEFGENVHKVIWLN